MTEFFTGLSPVMQAFLATLFTWGMTALGAALVFGTKKVPEKFLNAMLGFAGGVMIAASFWSLLAPAIELSSDGSLPEWLPPLIGFLLGGIFLRGLDLVLPHLHPGMKLSEAEGPPSRWRRSVLLVSAITLHNIPEGLAIGVAFGAVATGVEGATLGAALALALGIGLQNFPEGTAVSMPLRRDGMSRRKSFFYGQLSGAVEPLAAVTGAAAVIFAQPILPYALAFAAGAMIFVVAEELIPEAKRGSPDIAALSLMVGFAVMMTLDVALG
ncbi:ZIP family metal transporter [Rubrobacter indicoceani]|uniref:ZIP family metal transporter n=1 Tax=Rubrobacter indicoceani TaxID=2051957 RepID=UPI001F09DC49|nr:ZIP family metal transporter [Rubrobacter indicoceani]